MFAVNNITTYRPPVRSPNETRTRVVPHPSQGGNAYAPEVPEVCNQVISVWQNGGDLRSLMLECYLSKEVGMRWNRQGGSVGRPLCSAC